MTYDLYHAVEAAFKSSYSDTHNTYTVFQVPGGYMVDYVDVKIPDDAVKVKSYKFSGCLDALDCDNPDCKSGDGALCDECWMEYVENEIAGIESIDDRQQSDNSRLKITQREKSQIIVDVINKYTKELPWIERAYVNEDNRVCWFNGAYLSDYGWSYSMTMYTPKAAVIEHAIRRTAGVGIDLDNEQKNIAERFFDELFDACNNLGDGWFLESYDNHEATPIC